MTIAFGDSFDYLRETFFSLNGSTKCIGAMKTFINVVFVASFDSLRATFFPVNGSTKSTGATKIRELVSAAADMSPKNYPK